MANKNYNKQATPKGYKMGGRIKKMGGGMMKRPMYKEGGRTKKVQRFQMTEAQKKASKTTGEKIMKALSSNKFNPLDIVSNLKGTASLVLDRKKRLGKMGAGEKIMKALSSNKFNPLDVKGNFKELASLVLDRKKRLGKMGGGMMKRPMYGNGTPKPVGKNKNKK